PPRAQLRPVEQWDDEDHRADGAQDVGDIVDLGEVFTHERYHGRAFSGLDDLDRLAGDLDRLPPPDAGGERAPHGGLVALSLVERPTVVLGLADMHPVVAG